MEVYSLSNCPFKLEEYEHTIQIDHPTVPIIKTFRHCNLPTMGVGPNHQDILYFDEYVDKSLLPHVREEIINGTKNGHVKFNKLIAAGLLPANLNAQKTIDSYLANLSKYAKDNSWKTEIQKICRKGDLKSFFHDYFSVAEAWEGVAMFREYTGNYEDKAKPSQWMSLIEYFPKLRSLVESLPFKYIGYVMVLKSTPNNPVLIHRDYFPVSHRVHFMNIRLDQRPRPFFLYDIETGKKNYKSQDSDIFFFNETDLHGVDAEASPGLTLRIEGQFTEDFLNEINLPNGETFNWSFEKPQDFLNSGKFHIEESTDI